MIEWLYAFLFTQVVEVPIYMFALARSCPRVRPRAQRALIAFGASALTHPIVWFVIPRLIPSYFTMGVSAEAFAVFVEACYMYAFGARWAFAWSLFANAASVGLGLSSRGLFGWP
jgi:hypothetical protein